MDGRPLTPARDRSGCGEATSGQRGELDSAEHLRPARGKRRVTVAAYIRVSSRSQNNATQREAIKRASKARGHVIAHWFEEKRSAKTLERPVLSHVRDLARRGEVQRLYVFR